MKSVWFDAASRIVNATDGPFLPPRRQLQVDPHACVALALTNADEKQIDAFGDWFYPTHRKHYSPSWWGNPYLTDEDQEARRLALCFMHWIEKSEK